MNQSHALTYLAKFLLKYFKHINCNIWTTNSLMSAFRALKLSKTHKLFSYSFFYTPFLNLTLKLRKSILKRHIQITPYGPARWCCNTVKDSIALITVVQFSLGSVCMFSFLQIRWCFSISQDYCVLHHSLTVYFTVSLMKNFFA